MRRQQKHVLVTGDAVTDLMIYPREAACDKNLPAWRRLPGFSEVRQRGGALLLADLIKASFSDGMVLSEEPETVPLLSRMQLADYGGVWRASSLDGFDEIVSPASHVSRRPEKSQTVPSSLVVFDSGNGFTQTPSLWPGFIGENSFSGTAYIRICNPEPHLQLIDQLQEARRLQGATLVGFLDGDDLRAVGAAISRGLSWDRTMIDFCREMQQCSTLFGLLEKFDFMVVRFAYEGAIIVDCRQYAKNLKLAGGERLPYGSLIFDNAVGEGDLDLTFSGSMTGVTTVFMTGMLHCCVPGDGLSLDSLRQGVRRGLLVTRQYLSRLGFGKSDSAPAYPLAEIAGFLSGEPSVGDYSETELVEIDHDVPLSGDNDFSIVERLVPDTLTRLATMLVQEGDKTFQNIPKGIFGNVLTVERQEIENYRKIFNLMREYLENPSRKEPLSFAVFGPPGAGKSFGVKQLARKISDAGIANMNQMTFNLSEFASPDDLIAAFHCVHDASLEGKVPLVFFDEFDSTREGQALYWLKYFLAPMQDGLFRDGADVHPIGRAIFVFAGGTCETYKKFSGRSGDDFKDIKGPDFVSRLRGHLNIMGPNPVSDRDFGYIVRRGLLLRMFLEGRARSLGARKHELIGTDGHLKMDDGLLTAFLQVPKYRHGVRSMQAVIEMSAIIQGNHYGKSEVPPFDQLDMHVDAEAFLYLLRRDERFAPHVEKIARMIHETYMDDRRAEDALIPGKPSHQPWEKLDEGYRDSNRKQAIDIPAKLSLFDIRIEQDNGQEPTLLTADEIDYLARIEHRRWLVEEKQTPTCPVHPCMVRWEKLSEADKAKDITTIERIPKYLGACGLIILRGKGGKA